MERGAGAEKLLRLGAAYWGSKAFLTACRLGLFTAAGRGATSVEEAASALAISPRGAKVLMDGMAALGLLHEDGGRYALSPLSSEFLVEGAPYYMGDFFAALDAMFYEPFVEFERALREGSPVWSRGAGGGHRPISGDDVELFAKAMDGLGRLTARALAQRPELSQCRRLLDVGGGSGVMSTGLLRGNPGLEAVVLDRPAVCQLASRRAAQAGLSDRLKAVEGDIFLDDYPPGHDVHLYANMLHNFARDECAALLAKSFRALLPKGRIVVVDYLLGEDAASPEFPAMFNLFALVVTDGGASRSFEEYRGWLEGAGFRRVGKEPLWGPYWMVSAVKE